MSVNATSINLLRGLLFLLPGNSVLIPDHLSLESFTLPPNHLMKTVPLIYSFLILFTPVTPSENLSSLNSATTNSTSCLFVCVITEIFSSCVASCVQMVD